MTRQSKMYQVKAILFDMDGTLVDSTKVVERTWHRFAIRHQLDSHAVLAKAHGCRAAETVAHFAPKHIDHEQETAQVLAEEIADIEGIVAIDGAKKIVHALSENHWAIVTSANRELAIRRMNAAGLPIPTVLIAAEDVQQGKPAPDGYLAAAYALNVLPEECLVFEDAPAGIASAHAAGMRVVAVGRIGKQMELHNAQWIDNFTNVQLNFPTDNKDQIILTL